jgi:hypothetical protein
VVPLWQQISELMPGVSQALDNALTNKKLWTDYEETAEDKKVYEIKEISSSSESSSSDSDDDKP